MVSQYNRFVSEYAKKCRKDGKKFEIANAAAAWNRISGGDWWTSLGLKKEPIPFFTSNQANWEKEEKEMQDRKKHAKLLEDTLLRLPTNGREWLKTGVKTKYIPGVGSRERKFRTNKDTRKFYKKRLGAYYSDSE